MIYLVQYVYTLFQVQRLTTPKLKMFTIKFSVVFILKFNCMANFQNYFYTTVPWWKLIIINLQGFHAVLVYWSVINTFIFLLKILPMEWKKRILCITMTFCLIFTLSKVWLSFGRWVPVGAYMLAKCLGTFTPYDCFSGLGI